MQTPFEILRGPMIPNREGVAFTQSTARFQVAVAGRRSGKTLRAKRKFVQWAFRKPYCHVAACAPTRDQAKALFWDDLKALCKPGMVKPSESDLTIKLKHGGEVAVVGLDKPQRIEGPKWDGFLIDEVDEMKPEAWPSTLRPALADTKGFAWFIGRPKGFKLLYDLYTQAKNGAAEWAGFSWPSSDVVPEEELALAREITDPRLYRQEYEASFEAPAGRIYEDFTRTEGGNVRECPHSPGLPLVVGLDFNVDPMSAVFIQEHGPELWAVGSIELHNSHTSAFTKWLKDWLASVKQTAPVEIWCDPSGNARQHNIGTSDVAILRQAGLAVHFKGVGAESDKFEAVRAMILNAAGKRRLFVDPRNKRLIERLEQLGPDDEDDHLTDALAYAIYGKWDPVRKLRAA